MPPGRPPQAAPFETTLLRPQIIRSVARTEPSPRIPFDLSELASHPKEPHRGKEAATRLPVALPRGGVLEPKRKRDWVIHKKADQLPDEPGIPILCFQHSALGEDMMPGLHRTAALTFVSFMARNIEPPIVLAYRSVV